MSFDVNDFLNRPLIKQEDPEILSLEQSGDTSTKADLSSILIFEIGKSLLGIKTKSISSILTNPSVSQIPFIAKRDLKGFVSYTGYAVPVLDLAAILGLISNKNVDRLVIFAVEQLYTAFFPDRVLEVENLSLLDSSGSEQNSLLTAKAYYNSRPVSIINIEQLARIILKKSI